MSLWSRFKAWLFPPTLCPNMCSCCYPDMSGYVIGGRRDGVAGPYTVRLIHPPVAPGETRCPSTIGSIAHEFWVACDVRCPSCKAQK